MIWANFLHIYQPPTQKKYWVDKITRECYRPLMQGLLAIPSAKFTLNINAVLSELLVHYGHQDVIDMIRTLAENGQIEFTGSAKYHPLLPRIPKEEAKRQIHLNEETNKKIFGAVYAPQGFFPPEMAFSVEVARTVQELGYKWIICDELSFPSKGGKGIDYSKVYTVEGMGDFPIFFRERATSNKILSFQLTDASLIIDDLGERLGKNEYLLTAMDGETFGHHRLGLEKVLFDLYASSKVPSVHISDLPKQFKERQVVMPQPATWALMEKDLEQNLPFSRWDDKGNEIHQMQWELLYMAVDVVKDFVKDEGERVKGKEESKARLLLDQAIHSDQFWWAGAKPWWSIEYIESGAKQLKDVVFAVQDAPKQTKEKAQELYSKIITTAFDWQRSGKVDELSKSEDEEIRQRVDRELPQMQDAAFEQMIQTLETQREEAALTQEYERAGQFRDRIAELKEQWNKLRNLES